MIRTVVFDLGGVLVNFEAIAGLRKLGFSEEAVEAFREKIFGSGLWEDCDKYPYDDAQIRALFKEHVPGFEKEVDLLWDDDHLHALTGTRPYTEEWLRSLKERGYKIYILSNYGKRAFEINSKIYDFLSLADGKVISYEIEEVKPQPYIYQYLAEKYRFDPKEAVFIDDREINIKGAKACGYKGIVFKSYEQAKRELESHIIY